MLKKGDKYQGKYEVVGRLGKGGMGQVHLVMDTQLGSLWALKEVSKKLRPKETEAQRKKRLDDVINEAKLLSLLKHPDIPRVTEISDQEDYIYILQDYIEGVTLKESLDSQKNVKMEEFLAKNANITEDDVTKHVFRQLDKNRFMLVAKSVARIFIYLHSLNPPIVYRDLKPDNLMIDKNNNIKLIDFGIAYQLTPENTGVGKKPAMGTWGYAAPEQIGRNANPTTQTDIFNYGRMLYELMTGIVPATKVNGKLIELPPIREVRPDVDEGIEIIINKCMKNDPKDRYQDFNEVLYALDHYRELGSTYREKLKTRVKKFTLLASVSALCLGGAGVSTVIEKVTAKRAYQNMISQADMYNNVDDLIPVIQSNPKEIKPIQRLVQLYEKDGKFDLNEEQEFINLISPNIALLKENADYGDLAYEIGLMYIFYYQASDKEGFNYQLRLSQATQWFKDAVDYKAKNSDTAKVFYNLGVFNRDISIAQGQYNDKGMYKAYFKDLKELLDAYDNKNVTNYAKVQISNIICSTIAQYYGNLLEDGVKKEEMIKLLDDSKAKFEKLDLGNSDGAKKLKEQTENSYKTTYESINE